MPGLVDLVFAFHAGVLGSALMGGIYQFLQSYEPGSLHPGN